MTHRSRDGSPSYERLEFLGDRVLGLAIAETLYHRFPDEAEGALARRHAHLVRQDALARIARDLGLGPMMRLSRGEQDLGGQSNPSLLSDVCEALLGALYLDGGFEPAAAVIQRLWAPLIEADPTPPKDAKTALQEWAQGRGLPLPAYTEAGRSGPDHKPLFTVRVSLDGQGSESAQGASKRLAEQIAARRLLARLTGGPSPLPHTSKGRR